MENYSRSNKNKTKSSKKPTKQHIKTGLSAFQKTIATIASILSIIIASITIMNLTSHKDEIQTVRRGEPTPYQFYLK